MPDRRVALATCQEFAGLADDDRLVVGPLSRLGIQAEAAVWDDGAVDWSAYDMVVIRSTWDYPSRREEYLTWAERAPRVANAPAVLRWNTDKRYLRDLALAGLPVVETRWLEPRDEVILDRTGEYVVKPAVGAGSVDTGRYDLADEAQRDLAVDHVRRLLGRGATVMVQPYLSAVDTAGETALLFLGGEFSHAIRKGPMLEGPDTGAEGLYRPELITPREPSAAEHDVAAAVLDVVPGFVPDPLLYARVDLIPGADGQPVVLELELTEPSLFLDQAAGSAERFAAVIGTHLDRVLKTG